MRQTYVPTRGHHPLTLLGPSGRRRGTIPASLALGKLNSTMRSPYLDNDVLRTPSARLSR